MLADYTLANPPFSMSGWSCDPVQDDVRWKFGAPPVGKANDARGTIVLLGSPPYS